MFVFVVVFSSNLWNKALEIIPCSLPFTDDYSLLSQDVSRPLIRSGLKQPPKLMKYWTITSSLLLEQRNRQRTDLAHTTSLSKILMNIQSIPTYLSSLRKKN